MFFHPSFSAECGHGYNILPLGRYSSPKEAIRSAEAAFLGASAMFRGFKMGILGCCQVFQALASQRVRKTSVFIRVSEFSFTPYDT